ncbi:6931_t:CDS:2, partial [Gigaspora margarita]
ALNTLTSSHDDFQLYAISHNQCKLEDEEEYIDELDCYILEKPANKKIEVLAWWKVSVFNTLLAILATSIASERAFSSSKNMITNKRANLAPKTIRASQCLRSWMQGPLRGKLL